MTVVDEFMDYWNSLSALPAIRAMTPDRMRKLRNRMKEPLFADNWKSIVTQIAETPFLIGYNDRGWKANVDWLLRNTTNYVRVIENAYGNQKPKPKSLKCWCGQNAETTVSGHGYCCPEHRKTKLGW